MMTLGIVSTMDFCLAKMSLVSLMRAVTKKCRRPCSRRWLMYSPALISTSFFLTGGRKNQQATIKTWMRWAGLFAPFHPPQISTQVTRNTAKVRYKESIRTGHSCLLKKEYTGNVIFSEVFLEKSYQIFQALLLML